MERPLIEVYNLFKSYRRDRLEIPVLRNITLTVPDGEFVAFMGPSGSGKTTLLNLIAGIDKPTEGTILVAGTDVTVLSEGELAVWRSRNVGFVFQFYNLIPVLTAVENVELPLLVARVPGQEARARALEALDLVGIADLASENAAEIVELMRRLNLERGLSFLIVTHDISVGRKTDRIVRMLDGEVVEEQRLEVPHVLASHAA